MRTPGFPLTRFPHDPLPTIEQRQFSMPDSHIFQRRWIMHHLDAAHSAAEDVIDKDAQAAVRKALETIQQAWRDKKEASNDAP